MEKRTTLGFGGQDFYGSCPSCPTECEPEIQGLLTKFCQGLVIEDTSAWNRSRYVRWLPTASDDSGGRSIFIKSLSNGGARQNNNVIFPGISFYPSFGVLGGVGSGDIWNKTGHVESEEFSNWGNTRHGGDLGVKCPWLGSSGASFNNGQNVHTSIDVFTTFDNFTVFPICGDLQITDSGSNYNFTQVWQSSGSSFTEWGMRDNPEHQPQDNELFFILVKGICSDGISERSNHPHLLSTTNIGVGKNRGRFWRNSEQIKQLGLARTTTTAQLGTIVEERYCETPEPGWEGTGQHPPVQVEGKRFYVYPRRSSEPYYPTYNDAFDALIASRGGWGDSTGITNMARSIGFLPYFTGGNNANYGADLTPKCEGAGVNVFGKFSTKTSPYASIKNMLVADKWLHYLPDLRGTTPTVPSDLRFQTANVDINGFMLSETKGAKSFDLSSSTDYFPLDGGPVEAITYYKADLKGAQTSVDYSLNFQQVYQKQFSSLYLGGAPFGGYDWGTSSFKGGSISGLSFTASLK